jgi:hypothetical protein
MPEGFVAGWLHPEPPIPQYTRFTHQIFSEQNREAVFDALAETIFLYHTDPAACRHNLELLGYPAAAQQIEKRPRTENTRKGNFGEIVASEYLSQALGYEIPVYRLRYNPNPEQSMKGDDVLAFKFGNEDGLGREIVVGESKTRTDFSSNAVEEAYEQLAISCRRPHPISLEFVADHLALEGKQDKADAVLSFLNLYAPNKPTKRWLLFLVTGNRPHDPFGCLQTQEEEIIENLVAVNLSVDNLSAWINRLFEQEIDAHEL